MHDELERVCRAACEGRFWTEGWIAVLSDDFLRLQRIQPRQLSRLALLETLLRPRDLVQKVRSIVLSDDMIHVGLNSTFDEASDVGKTTEEVQETETARDLGRAIAVDQATFMEVLPDLIMGNSLQLWDFGGGLAEGAEQPRVIWTKLVTHLAAMPTKERNPRVDRGFGPPYEKSTAC